MPYYNKLVIIYQFKMNVYVYALDANIAHNFYMILNLDLFRLWKFGGLQRNKVLCEENLEKEGKLCQP